jgi:O-methyltransferase involved in polyketide biosynthesis
MPDDQRRLELVPDPPAGPMTEIDSTRPHQARVYDYWLGGKDNYAVDREVGERAIRDFPGIIRGVRAQREFLGMAVRWLAGPAGIGQFLDIGCGLPAANNTHEVAQRANPAARIVYVDNDPLVLSHARALLASGPDGVTAYIDADARNPGQIIRRAARTLDFRRPVAVLLIGILQLVPDEDAPREIVRRLMARVPPGSWLAVVHPASDIAPELVTMASRLNERSATPSYLRDHATVTSFFDGLDLLAPGVVPLGQWEPGAPAAAGGEEIPAYCGLAVKR